MVYTTQSPQETKQLAKQFAKTLRPGDTVALYGALGSGKTTFIQGLAKPLGVNATVNSPTFVMVKPYGILVHADLYRVKSLEDLETTGLDDFLGSPAHIVVVEWPQLLENKLPPNAKRINFEFVNETTRKITID